MPNQNKTPYAFYFTNLHYYNKENFPTLQDVVVFEYLLMLGVLYQLDRGQPDFYHSMTQLKESLRLNEHTIDQKLAKLEKLKFITVNKRGLPATRYFRVNFKWLSNNLSKVYTAVGVKVHKEYFEDLHRRSQ